jgi:hypothetical protein
MPRYPMFAVPLCVLLGGGAAIAGPCSVQIDKEQAKIDAALDQQAEAGKTGVESAAATDSRQPTPASIAAAEKALGRGGVDPRGDGRAGSRAQSRRSE